MIKVDAGCYGICGRRRRNEDAYGVSTDVDGWDFYLVSDGMGGHPNGDQASQVAVHSFPTAFADLSTLERNRVLTTGSRYEAFRQRVVEAFFRVSMQVYGTGGGATLTVLMVRRSDGRVVVGWIGDSPAALLRPSADGSFRTERFFGSHGLGCYLDRSLGSSRDKGDVSVRAEVMDWGLARPGDFVVLCSDGVSGVYPTSPELARLRGLGEMGRAEAARAVMRFEEKFGQLVESHAWPQIVAQSLCESAVEDGSTDNCTAVCVRFS